MGTVPLCPPSAIMRPHMEHSVQTWGPQRRRDVGLDPEEGMGMLRERVRGCSEDGAPLYGDTLREPGVLSLEKGMLQGDLSAASQYL